MKWKLKREYEHITNDRVLAMYVEGVLNISHLFPWSVSKQGYRFWAELRERELDGDKFVKDEVLGIICIRNEPEDCTWV